MIAHYFDNKMNNISRTYTLIELHNTQHIDTSFLFCTLYIHNVHKFAIVLKPSNNPVS